MFQPLHVSRFVRIVAIPIAVMISAQPTSGVDKYQAQLDKARRDQERRAAEERREFDRRVEESRRKFEETRARLKHAATPPGFVASAAPAPEVCFDQFLTAARKATSMEEVLPFLRHTERETLKALQTQYDPKLAEERRRKYRQEGKLDEEAIAHLTGSPYANALKFNQSIAAKIQKLLSVEVDGDKATLEVSIQVDAVINGTRYTRGTATIGMVGEGERWYYVSFKESNVVYR